MSITTFRLASNQRRFDRSQERWIDGDTNWYTITAFRQLATNVATSVSKGERVVITGRLRIREWENGDRTGMNVDIEADSLGHDLAWGTAQFVRTISAAKATDSGGTASADEVSRASEGEQEPGEEHLGHRSEEAESASALPF